MKKQKGGGGMRIVDARDPVWSSLDKLTAGLDPHERFKVLDNLVKKLTASPPPEKFDLDNLPFDPAVELMREAQKHLAQEAMTEAQRAMEQDDDPNRSETEEDGLRAGELRRYKAHHQSKAFTGQTPESSNSQGNTPKKTKPLISRKRDI